LDGGREMSGQLYEETIYSRLMGVIVIGVIILFMIISLIPYLTDDSTTPQPYWIFFIMLIILFIIVDFVRLNIKITPSYLSAAFGIFKYKVHLDNIQNYYEDKEFSIR
jgi:hypothetical protein